MFNNMLHNIIPISILDEIINARMQLREDLSLRLLRTMLKHPLDHATSIRVGSKTMNMALESFDDERNVLRRNALDRLLDYMVAVLVFDAFENVAVELFHESCLLFGEDVFKGLTGYVRKE